MKVKCCLLFFKPAWTKNWNGEFLCWWELFSFFYLENKLWRETGACDLWKPGFLRYYFSQIQLQTQIQIQKIVRWAGCLARAVKGWMADGCAWSPNYYTRQKYKKHTNTNTKTKHIQKTQQQNTTEQPPPSFHKNNSTPFDWYKDMKIWKRLIVEMVMERDKEENDDDVDEEVGSWMTGRHQSEY